MTAKADDPFFVAYFKKVHPSIRRFALTAGAGIVAGMGLLALVIPMGAADPGSGRYANDLMGATLTGVVEDLPYPILRVPADGTNPARALLLGGQRKTGVQGQLGGRPVVPVTLGGVYVLRGDLTMLLVTDQAVVQGMRPEAGFQTAPAEDLGRWRLAGEICDGKCYAGAMKPGRGLAHKACANLCIETGLPPVLVMELPVLGATVVLLADKDGGPMPEALYDLTAMPVTMEGRLERRDDLLIFRIDPGSTQRM